MATQLRSGNNITLEVRGNGEKIKNALSAIKGVKKVVWHDEGEFGNFVVEAERGVDVREDVFVNVVKNNGIIREMKQASITLEEIFHQITMQEQEVTA